MIKQLLLILVVSTLLICRVSAQSIADIQMPKILPPAPDAAALGKYGQIPVDKSTGIPSISIPLYEIKTPRFTLPISLSYHSSGIKVDETASWVGIGWSLNAGGVVTRSMVDLADDGVNGYLYGYHIIPQAQDIINNYHADSTFLQNVCHNIQDSQPDNFFYNFAQQSGAFIFGPDAARTPLLTPYKPLNITYTGVGSNSSFTIIDDKGDTYIFHDNEFSTSNVSADMSGVSSWYLSKMISADKSDTIKFYYNPDASVFIDNAYSFTQNLGPENGPTAGNQLWNMVDTRSTFQTQPIHIDSIVFNGGKVIFKAKTGRKDNGSVSLDSVLVYNYDFNKKVYNKLKSFKLVTDYFYSSLNNPAPYNYNTDSVGRYRLRLSGLSENDVNNNAIKTHQFSYNSTMLPPVHNFGQDIWGYYNGNWSNPSLLQTQQVISTAGTAQTQSYVYTIGGGGIGGDRSLSATYMQAGILQQITYPTKGYTTFTYEPNQYLAPAITTYTPSASSVGVYEPSTSVNFTPGFVSSVVTSGQLIFHVQLKNILNLSNSYVKVIETDNNAVLYYYSPNSYTDVDINVPITVTAGVQYTLLAVSIGGTSGSSTLPVSAISTSYQTSGTPVATNVGGLRISAINNFDSNGAVVSTDTYKYGLNENGTGDFMTASSLLVNQSQHLYQFSETTQPLSWQAEEMTYSNSSVYPLSSLNGSPVGYEYVTVYHGTTSQNIGKSVYNYQITPDSIIVNPNTFLFMPASVIGPVTYTITQGIRPIPVLWKNGDPISEMHYLNNGSGNYLLEQAKITNYKLFYRAAGNGLYVQSSIEEGTPGATLPGNEINSNDFIFYNYPISTGSRMPIQTISINYAPDGVTAQTQDTTKYYYANHNHMYPTTIVNYDGHGDSLLKQVSYPQDMVAAGNDPTGIYAAMTTANIIDPAIKVTELKNTTQLMQSITNYSSTNNIINPHTVSLQVMNNPAETRLNYQKYDNFGNLLTVSKQSGPPVSYQWGYKSTYPVAQATNSASNDIFYDSFEEGDGNSALGTAKTGHYSHTGAYSKVLTGLDAGSYLLSYWQLSGTSWSLVTTPVTVSGTSYTISLNIPIDDVRLYPVNAQMTTYTYDPLIGMTSSTDAKGEVTYYEYDGLQRLMNIKDKDGNIVKHTDYHYKGQ